MSWLFWQPSGSLSTQFKGCLTATDVYILLQSCTPGVQYHHSLTSGIKGRFEPLFTRPLFFFLLGWFSEHDSEYPYAIFASSIKTRNFQRFTVKNINLLMNKFSKVWYFLNVLFDIVKWMERINSEYLIIWSAFNKSKLNLLWISKSTPVPGNLKTH